MDGKREKQEPSAEWQFERRVKRLESSVLLLSIALLTVSVLYGIKLVSISSCVREITEILGKVVDFIG